MGENGAGAGAGVGVGVGVGLGVGVGVGVGAGAGRSEGPLKGHCCSQVHCSSLVLQTLKV